MISSERKSDGSERHVPACAHSVRRPLTLLGVTIFRKPEYQEHKAVLSLAPRRGRRPITGSTRVWEAGLNPASRHPLEHAQQFYARLSSVFSPGRLCIQHDSWDSFLYKWNRVHPFGGDSQCTGVWRGDTHLGELRFPNEHRWTSFAIFRLSKHSSTLKSSSVFMQCSWHF